jgi:hypothetical protein
MSSRDGLPQQLRSSHIVHTHPEKIRNGKISNVHIRVCGSINNTYMPSFIMYSLQVLPNSSTIFLNIGLIQAVSAVCVQIQTKSCTLYLFYYLLIPYEPINF